MTNQRQQCLKEEGEFLEDQWATSPRWQNIERSYSGQDVVKLRGSIRIEHTLAERGALNLWALVNSKTSFVRALGALTGNQALQMAQAGLKAIYLSGWQVAADANTSDNMYPDQSLYPANSVPTVVRKINHAFQRADQIQTLEGTGDIDWFKPIVADAEAGFGGNLNAFELMKQMIEAGAAGVHFEDQLASAKKCGHMGGKVLVPTQEQVRKLTAARLAADVLGVDTLIVARTDANSAKLITDNFDDRDRPFILDTPRTPEGFHNITGGIDMAIARGLAFAPIADLLWCETSMPDLDEARQFADAIHAKFPGKLLAYNCSPSFNWRSKMTDSEAEAFQNELNDMGYKFQFVTLAGFHALNNSMFELATEYRERGMGAYSELQQREFANQANGFQAVTHQKFVGTSYFDAVSQVVMDGDSSTTALSGSTEEDQF